MIWEVRLYIDMHVKQIKVERALEHQKRPFASFWQARGSFFSGEPWARPHALSTSKQPSSSWESGQPIRGLAGTCSSLFQFGVSSHWSAFKTANSLNEWVILIYYKDWIKTIIKDQVKLLHISVYRLLLENNLYVCLLRKISN